jgi:UDP-N-acetylmuramoyl-L-alanyl-D-glutamate--2,6-diaminopimelate ligase
MSERGRAAGSPARLAELAARVPGAEVRGDGGVVPTEVAFDSREVPPGAVFFAVPGERADGHAFAPAAVAAGAVALVVERPLEEPGVPQVVVPSVRAAMGPIAAGVFGDPAAALTLVGITGTNGKTTATYLFEGVFAAAGLAPGLVGTTGARIGGAPAPLARTTPEAPDLHRLLARMRDEGVRAVALEASSHALAQGRLDGIVVDAALFTNLSRDHLDYHGTMEAYFQAKAMLFTPAHAVLGCANADDPSGRRLLETATIPMRSFALDHPADLQAADLVVDRHGIEFRVGDLTVRSRLRGRFNVSNALGVVAVARALGIDEGAIARGIAAVPGVPGRVEPVGTDGELLVVVDYAHTPDSILSVLRAARPLASGRLICVFGCGGDRDRDKRPLMGAAATAAADLTVITSDNPRSEDPMAIIASIEEGARGTGGRYRVEPDRRAAILGAIAEAEPGDVVVIAGKGHETTQELADRTVPFDDREVAREALAARRPGDGAARGGGGVR